MLSSRPLKNTTNFTVLPFTSHLSAVNGEVLKNRTIWAKHTSGNTSQIHSWTSPLAIVINIYKHVQVSNLSTNLLQTLLSDHSKDWYQIKKINNRKTCVIESVTAIWRYEQKGRWGWFAACTHTHTHILLHACTHTYLAVCMHTHILLYAHTHTHTHILLYKNNSTEWAHTTSICDKNMHPVSSSNS